MIAYWATELDYELKNKEKKGNKVVKAISKFLFIKKKKCPPLILKLLVIG